MEPIVSFLVFLFFLIVILVIIVKARRKRFSGSYSRNTSYHPRYDSNSYGEGYRDAVRDQDRKREESYARKERERDDDRERRRVPRDEGSRISDVFEGSASDSAKFANDFFGFGKKRRKK